MWSLVYRSLIVTTQSLDNQKNELNLAPVNVAGTDYYYWIKELDMGLWLNKQREIDGIRYLASAPSEVGGD